MIVKNNKPKSQFFRYKLNGKVLKVFMEAYDTIDIQDLTETSQILSNTYEKRLRHIEETTGKNLNTAFEIPGDPDFIVFVIVSSTSLSGTISPLGSINVPEKENQIFYMTPDTVSFYASAVTMGNSGGTISPSGLTVPTNAYYYLSGLTVNSDTTKVSAVTGSVSATTTYTFYDVITAHTISSIFSLAQGAINFTFTPQSNYYLNSMTIDNGNNQTSAVTGSLSGVCTYQLSGLTSGKYVRALFKAYGQ